MIIECLEHIHLQAISKSEMFLAVHFIGTYREKIELYTGLTELTRQNKYGLLCLRAYDGEFDTMVHTFEKAIRMGKKSAASFRKLRMSQMELTEKEEEIFFSTDDMDQYPDHLRYVFVQSTSIKHDVFDEIFQTTLYEYLEGNTLIR